MVLRLMGAGEFSIFKPSHCISGLPLVIGSREDVAFVKETLGEGGGGGRGRGGKVERAPQDTD